jgi:peptide/nickel transport system permease protein
MKSYIIKRLLQMIPLLIGISLITFFVMHMAPGDPTSLFTDPNIKPEELARIRANWGLDKPVIMQYLIWLKNAVHLDLGYSYISGRPVIQEIAERMPATLILMSLSYFFILLISIPVGVISAVKKNSAFDNIFTIISFTFMAIPTFWMALVFMMIFSLYLGWLPPFGNIVLPVAVMVISGLAGITRYQRASMIEVLGQEYIKVARAKGMPENIVIYKHALRNALIPIITLLGMSLPDLFGGAFIVETIFAWPGMGRLGVSAVFSRNYPEIMAITLITAVLIVCGNLLADIGYAIIDPRIRYAKEK